MRHTVRFLECPRPYFEGEQVAYDQKKDAETVTTKYRLLGDSFKSIVD